MLFLHKLVLVAAVVGTVVECAHNPAELDSATEVVLDKDHLVTAVSKPDLKLAKLGETTESQVDWGRRRRRRSRKEVLQEMKRTRSDFKARIKNKDSDNKSLYDQRNVETKRLCKNLCKIKPPDGCDKQCNTLYSGPPGKAVGCKACGPKWHYNCKDWAENTKWRRRRAKSCRRRFVMKGRRAAMTMMEGIGFQAKAGSNRAGNDEAMLDLGA